MTPLEIKSESMMRTRRQLEIFELAARRHAAVCKGRSYTLWGVVALAPLYVSQMRNRDFERTANDLERATF